MYKFLLKPILFLLDAEKAHYATFSLFKTALKVPLLGSLIKLLYASPADPVNLFGLEFPNRVGLAAGLDKNAMLVDEFASLGFGFIEIGTVTPKPQPGNPKPRLFRLKEDKALINRMGFNNDGVQVVTERLSRKKSKVIVGGNIGKNKITPNEEAVQDYLKCFDALYPYVDYFVVNVSSPNTPDLRALQEKEPLKRILRELQTLNGTKEREKPVLLKIAPDLNEGQLDEIIEIVEETRISGIIATNTTVSREGLKTSAGEVEEIGAGGLSGKPLTSKSTEIIRYICKKTENNIPVIASGGVMSARDASEKIAAGARLVQVYSGLIYNGPALVRSINRHLTSQKN